MSLGVQSFENDVLRYLGRIHDKNDAFTSFQRAKRAGFSNINMDVMFAIPGQSMKMWADTVRQCIFLKPSHISLYSLQIEEGTEFYELYKDGKMEAVPESQDQEMYHKALAMMKEAGYKHYRISMRPCRGCESRHNLKYWSYAEYLGLGLGSQLFRRWQPVQKYQQDARIFDGHPGAHGAGGSGKYRELFPAGRDGDFRFHRIAKGGKIQPGSFPSCVPQSSLTYMMRIS